MLALHGGGEYAPGDEAAMDALVGAAYATAPVGQPARIVIVPTAVARHRPELAAAHGERAFTSAAERAGHRVTIEIADIRTRADAHDQRLVERLPVADLIHFPGGDPDLIPATFAGTPAWAAILRALERGGCLAGASAGAMALAERCWTPEGFIDGLDLLHGYAVLPHFRPGRQAAWRSGDPRDARLWWLGLDEQTLVIGRPGGTWRVAGRGRAHVMHAGGKPGDEGDVTAGAGGSIRLG